MKTLADYFVGKNVSIYPGSSWHREGIVLDVTDAGVIFKLTQVANPDFGGRDEGHTYNGWTVGKTMFIAFSAELTIQEA